MSLRKRRPQECPRCRNAEFLMDCEEDLHCLECDVSFRKKKRQGRSRESRSRIIPKFEMNELICRGCRSVDFVEDHASGDLVCMDCGWVHSEGGLDFNENMIRMKNPSKRYMRIVHFQQRMTQLLGNDPEVSEEVVEKLEKRLMDVANKPQFGKRSFTRVLRELTLDPKIACHWVQLRTRLGWDDQLCCFHEELLLRLKARYFCIEKAFEETLHVPTGVRRTSKLQRKNIISLNFSIPMLIRMEDEEVFKQVAKFFPQQSNPQHPELNNERWKILIEHCQKKYARMVLPVKDMVFYFDWPFIPMTYADVIGYYSNFH